MESEEYRDNRFVSKTETIKLLNNTIERLEAIVKEVESKSEGDLPDLASVKTLAKNIESLSIAVGAPQTLKSVSQPEKPATNNRRTIAILSAVVVLIVAGFWLWLSPPPLNFLNRQAPAEVEVIKEPPETIATKSSEITENPEVAPPIEIAPEAEQPPKLDAAENLDASIPLELTAPADEKNVSVKTVEIPIRLTPEQSLIEAVRERVTAITQEYPENSILSVRADFGDSKLLVKLSDRWYELSEARQSQLADEILARSRKLDFEKLELKDADDNLLARSPVVGDRAIIYNKRRGVNDEE